MARKLIMQTVEEEYEYILDVGFQRRNIKPDDWGPIDFILVCEQKALEDSDKLDYITTFVKNLQKFGLKFEFQTGNLFKALVFIKVYGGDIAKYADILKVDLTCNSHNYYYGAREAYFNFMATELTKPHYGTDLFKRAPQTFGRERPTEIRTIERIVLVYLLLEKSHYGIGPFDCGYNNLIGKKVLITGYPLHDGHWRWNEDEPLNDRQLLFRYWAKMRNVYKQQPLDVVQNYFGPDLAYYFAFCGYYNQWLITASVFGLICLIFGLIYSTFTQQLIVSEICDIHGEELLCPMSTAGNWKYPKVKELCLYAYVDSVFDHPFIALFAVFMALWATSFIGFWKRYHATLTYRWNISFEDNFKPRLEFERAAKFTRVSSITGELEYCDSKKHICASFAISTISCLIMLAVVMSGTFFFSLFAILYEEPHIYLRETYKDNQFVQSQTTLIISLITAVANVIFIATCERIHEIVAYYLTIYENPRTQEELEHSYIYKIFILHFVNSFSSLFYLAIIKGRFFSHPGHNPHSFSSDRCIEGTCMFRTFLTLSMLIIVKSVGKSIGELLKMYARKLWILIKYFYYYLRGIQYVTNVPQWERDYRLIEFEKFFLLDEYLALTIQFGLVTFFVAAFPLGPIFALLGNAVRLRLDAIRFIKTNRRPIPFLKTRMKIITDLFGIMVYISVVTNAFVIAFTTDLPKKEVYKWIYNQKLKGYLLNYTFSRFDMKDWGVPSKICYYYGMRYPPDHHNKYQHTWDYWIQIVARFIMAFIFEHFVMVVNTILQISIPTMPHNIRKLLIQQKEKERDFRLNEMERMNSFTSI